MKKSSQLFSVLVAAALLTMIACSETKKTSKKSSTTKTTLQKTSKFFETYRFVEDGANGFRCDTNRQEFGSNKSYDEVKKQLCETLKDSKKNNNCAEASRKELFAKKCSSYAWNTKPTTKIPSTSSVTSLPAKNPTLNTSTTNTNNNTSTQNINPNQITNANWMQYKPLANAFSVMLAEKYELSKEIKLEQLASVTKYFEDLLTCGFSRIGVRCFDTDVSSVQLTPSFNKIDGDSFIYLELMTKDIPLLHILRIEQLEPLKLGRLEVYQMLKKRDNTDIATYLSDSANIQPWGTAVISNNAQELAIKRQAQAKNLKELYHMTDLLGFTDGPINLRNTPKWTEVEKDLKENINKSISYFSDSTDAKYLDLFLSILPVFSDSVKSFSEIYKVLANSKIDSIQSEASTILYKSDPKANQSLKPQVIKNLSSTYFLNRVNAIKALSADTMTIADEISILKMIADTNIYVTQAAEDAAKKITISKDHLAVVKELSKNQKTEIRIAAITLFAKMNLPEGNRAIIEMLADTVSVAQSASKALVSAKLDTSYLLELAANMTHKDWNNRLATADVIASIKSDNSTTVLIKFINDNQYEVFSRINKELQQRSIKDLHLSLIEEKLQSQNWVIRDYMVALLAKNNSESAKKILKNRLAKETNNDVKNDIIKALGL